MGGGKIMEVSAIIENFPQGDYSFTTIAAMALRAFSLAFSMSLSLASATPRKNPRTPIALPKPPPKSHRRKAGG
jgi:hypothetical protein